VPRGIDITFTPYVHYKSGSGNNFGAETYWACTDWDQTLLNPTWTEFLSGLNGGTPATDRIYTSSGGTVSAAALSSAGCTGPGTSIFLRVRKHPSANFTGSHVLLGVEVKYTSAMTF